MINDNFREHLLVVLMEECAEVQQACSKILRFGGSEANRMDLFHEWNDLLATTEMIRDEGLGSFMECSELKEKKKEKVKRYYESVQSHNEEKQ